MHETIHILGFSYGLFPYYIDKSTGKYYGLSNMIETVKVRGLSTVFLKTPNVLKTAREMYGCKDA